MARELPGGDGALALAAMLELKSRGRIEESLWIGDVEHARRRVTSPAFRPTPFRAGVAYELSRFAYVRREGAELVMESPESHWNVRLLSSRATTWLGGVDAAAESVEAPGTCFLAEAGMLTESDAGSAEGETARSAWEFHDRLFHWRSRRDGHSGTLGGTYRFAEAGDPAPLPERREQGEAVPLARLSGRPGADLFAVMDARRSVRPENETVSLSRLGEILYHAARETETAVDGTTRRMTYPTPGGLGALDVYVAAERCDGLTPGMYRYDASAHVLQRVHGDSEYVDALLDAAGRGQGRETRPAMLLTLAIPLARVAWKYEGIAYSLVLKTAGCLLQNIALAATALDVASCNLGTGNNIHFARATRLPDHVVSPVAEITLG